MRTTFTKFTSTGFLLCLFLLTGQWMFGQGVPEYMYFKFDAPGNQQNFASAPVGNNPATLNGYTIGSTGQFGTALEGNGGSSSSNNLNTGWATNLPSSGWTISLWVNGLPSNTTLYYFFGDAAANSFRCFIGGVAGSGNMLLRGGGLTDVLVNGVAPGPSVIHFVYTGSSVKAFLNGVLVNTVTQPSVTVSGSGPFLVAGYSTTAGVPSGGLMDEFRMYNRALYDAEVGQTWDHSLPLSGPPIVTTNPATGVTSTGATLNGTVNANGATTTVTFQYGLTTAYGNTVSGVPASVTGNTDTPVSAVIGSLLPGTTYHFRAVGANTNGTVNGNDMTFTTLAMAPTVVTLPATGVTSTDAILNGTVQAGGASTSVTFEYGLTASYGTTVPGVPATVTGNTVTPVSANITGLTVNTTYHFRVVGTNSVSTSYGNDLTFLTTTCPPPGPAGVITGPTNGCENSVGNIYSVDPISLATGYNWTVPPGATITAGANTNSITVTFGTSSGTVSVAGTNSCGTGAPASVNVTLAPAPVPTISGPDTMCVNSGFYYYVTEPGYSNYTWVLTGGTITYGAGTNQVQVQWTTAGAQSISVNYTNANGCPGGTPALLPVMVQGSPGPAGTITGTNQVCGGAMGVPYSVAPIPDAIAYVWTLPAGATIATGFGTNSITVDFASNATSGAVTVYGNNLCGNGSVSPSFPVTVSPLPDAAGPVTGPADVCEGMMNVGYSVALIANATGYTWMIPAGATISSGNNTNSITVDFPAGASSGDISVYGTNTCGGGEPSPDLAVSVNPVPPAPVITLMGDYLMSDTPDGNQWYLDGTAIPGATSQTYTPVASGTYTDIVTMDGCSSDPSNEILFIMTGIPESAGGGQITVYPNPGTGLFTVFCPGLDPGRYSVTLVNTLGSVVYQTPGFELPVTLKGTLDLQEMAPGVYSLVLRDAATVQVTKLIIRK